MSKAQLWAGRIISTLVVLLFAMGIATGIKGGPQVTEGFARYGFQPSFLKTVLILEGISILLYAIPATSVLGAIVLTGYLGGAVCTHMRVGEAPTMAVVVAVLAWLGLWLREGRLHAVLPLRR